ncbi:hypothetical protein PLICRDRAFT_488697 [Plicaturopsis crispa FD-325 SS-3]|nr:hypothetical protein PLICRDRAFT_488697 [Plicaturopsis crispa FD-325 SS-3]
MKRTFLDLVLDAYRKYPEATRADLGGKTVMVIGANTGLGLEATIHFASMNPARIIMACRSLERGNAAAAKVEKATGYQHTEVWLVDLANFSTVIEFVEKFERDGGRLDIVVANAGIATTSYAVSPEGWESTLQVNYLSTTLISLLLLPILERTAKDYSTTPRLSVVGSGAHYSATLKDDVLKSPKILEKLNDKAYTLSTGMRVRYAVSKLLDIFFVRALSDHLGPSSPVVVNNPDPGLCYSELRREISSIFVSLFERLLAHTAEEGSRQLVYAAVSGVDSEMHGAEAQRRIWDETIEILSKVTPKLSGIAHPQASCSGGIN